MILRGLLPAALLVLAGCGGEKAVVSVSGVVTFDGKPLVNAFVSFQPDGPLDIKEESGYGSSARTDEAGRYVLRYADPTKKVSGAVVGLHRVSITVTGAREGVDEIIPVAVYIPTRYNSESTLMYDVPPGGTSAANFDLTSAPNPAPVPAPAPTPP